MPVGVTRLHQLAELFYVEPVGRRVQLHRLRGDKQEWRRTSLPSLAALTSFAQRLPEFMDGLPHAREGVRVGVIGPQQPG